jgi:hypothetical protein
MGCARILVLILACCLLLPSSVWSQDSRGPPQASGTRGFRLGENYPNPVNPETWIPFELDEQVFRGTGVAVVTIRIVNVLAQTVAVPTALDHPAGPDLRIEGLVYTSPGRKVAYWDGRDQAGRLAPTGVYYYQMVVNDLPSQPRKFTVENPRRTRRIIPWFGRN